MRLTEDEKNTLHDVLAVLDGFLDKHKSETVTCTTCSRESHTDLSAHRATQELKGAITRINRVLGLDK